MFCRQGGERASLASIHSPEEKIFVQHHMRRATVLPFHRDYWIGLFRGESGGPRVGACSLPERLLFRLPDFSHRRKKCEFWDSKI